MQTDYAKTSAKQAEGDFEFIHSNERLMELRARGLTIKAMADVLGVSREAVYQRVRAHLEIYSPLASAGTVTLIRKLQAK